MHTRSIDSGSTLAALHRLRLLEHVGLPQAANCSITRTYPGWTVSPLLQPGRQAASTAANQDKEEWPRRPLLPPIFSFKAAFADLSSGRISAIFLSLYADLPTVPGFNLLQEDLHRLLVLVDNLFGFHLYHLICQDLACNHNAMLRIALLVSLRRLLHVISARRLGDLTTRHAIGLPGWLLCLSNWNIFKDGKITALTSYRLVSYISSQIVGLRLGKSFFSPAAFIADYLHLQASILCSSI